MKANIKYLLLLTIPLFILACGSSGSSDNGDNGGSSLQATLSSIQANIFTPTCATSGCHSSTTAQEGLSLADGEAFDNLVDVFSTQAPSLTRVETGDANSSYLINKLEGTQSSVGGSGVQMPKEGTLLTSAQIDKIKEWINNGALDN